MPRAAFFRRPELLFRPLQFFRRIGYVFRSPSGMHRVTLPWGLVVEVDGNERIGSSILKTGSYDTAVLEVLARLVEPGETCLDVGANFGLMSSALAMATGPKGKVIAFEPHPELAKSFSEHAADWQSSLKIGDIKLHQVAVSNTGSRQTLHTDEEFSSNRGTAHITSDESASGTTVSCVRLDDFLPEETGIGVMKIDIEGHEKAALEGAAGLLASGTIRDIVFECHDGYPSEVSEVLAENGYEIFLIRKGLLRPLLMPPETSLQELPNFLATRDPGRARRLVKPMGYRVLKHQLGRPTKS